VLEQNLLHGWKIPFDLSIGVERSEKATCRIRPPADTLWAYIKLSAISVLHV